VKISLSTEGTYPFVLGGVSTWVDMLVHGLPQHEFEIGALVDNPHHRIQYRPPPNVTLQPIPLWGLELAEEYLPRPEGWRRALRTSSPVVRDRFLPSWEHLVDCLAAPEADSQALGDSLSEVAHFAERYDLRRALGDAAAWTLLLDRLQANPIHARTGLAPAMEFARTMYRYLLPLTAPTPVCDVAHSTAAALCALPAIVAKYRYGTPLVLTEHGIYLRERLLAMSTEPFGTKVLFANFYRAVVELAYREADVLTPVCGYNAGWEEALGVEPDRIRVIHNGVDPARIDVWPEPDGAPTVGFVGRIDPLKDVLTLIQAFARVRKVMRNARLRIWGPPTSPAYLKQCEVAVRDLGLTDAVTFEGSTNDIAAAYGSSHVIALSSIPKPFPTPRSKRCSPHGRSWRRRWGELPKRSGRRSAAGRPWWSSPVTRVRWPRPCWPCSVHRRQNAAISATGCATARSRYSRRNACSTTMTTSTTSSSNRCPPRCPVTTSRGRGRQTNRLSRTGPWRMRCRDHRNGTDHRVR
jgi:glycosyltransferase involved in cell wall biosynthesis